MQTAAHGSRQVQLGRLAGLTLEPPAPTVRSPALDIRGMAVFHAPLEVRRRAYRDLTGHPSRGAITVDLAPVPLTEVATAWEQQRGGPGVKQVLTAGACARR